MSAPSEYTPEEPTDSASATEPRLRLLVSVIAVMCVLAYVGFALLAGVWTAADDQAAPIATIVSGQPIYEVQTATYIDAEYQPVDPADHFRPDNTIYITYRVRAAAPGDVIRVVYIVNGATQPEHPNDRDTFRRGGNVRGYFVIQGSVEHGLATGDYRAELFYNDAFAAAADFTVAEETQIK